MSGANGKFNQSEPQLFYGSSPYHWQHGTGSTYNTLFNQLATTPKGVIYVKPNTTSEINSSQSAIFIESGNGIRPEIVIDDFVITKELFTEIREEINQIKEQIKEIREIILELQYAPGGKFYNEAESDFKKNLSKQ